MRVFIDAPVIIAAMLSPTGGSFQVFRYMQLGVITGITSQSVLDEVISKTGKINRSKKEIEYFVEKSGLVVRKRVTQEEIIPYKGLIDATDAHLMAGATLTKCKLLVTLDKRHLLRPDVQKKLLPLMVVSPKEMLQTYLVKN